MTAGPASLAATRDPDAGVRVAALYEDHARTVLGLCRFLLRDAVEAEDATQQAFLSAYRSLLGGVEPREPAAWLATIARNECWARIRRRMREPLALPEVPSELPDPLQLAVRNADLAALRSGLQELPRPQREAFLLREFSGLSYGELATALGVSEPAVESLLFRARTRLRRALGATNALLAPVALRDQLAQLIPGFGESNAGAVAKIASLPLVAKLAAAGAGAVLVGAGAAGLEHHAGSRRTAAPAAASPHVLRARVPSLAVAGRGVAHGGSRLGSTGGADLAAGGALVVPAALVDAARRGGGELPESVRGVGARRVETPETHPAGAESSDRGARRSRDGGGDGSFARTGSGGSDHAPSEARLLAGGSDGELPEGVRPGGSPSSSGSAPIQPAPTEPSSVAPGGDSSPAPSSDGAPAPPASPSTSPPPPESGGSGTPPAGDGSGD